MFNSVTLFFMTALLSASEEAESLPIWFWVLLVLILVVLPILVLVFGPGLRRKEIEEVEAAQEIGGGAANPHHHEEAVATVEHVQEADPEPEVPAPIKPDDLKKIEGIGPKIASVLAKAGIETFAQLAEAEVSRLQAILDEQPRLRLADPTTWPQQARLAAAGQWEELQKLQDELQGGRE